MRDLLKALLVVSFIITVNAQPRYDVLLKNGHVIDPKNQINERRDIAIASGVIAAVEKNINPATAKQVIDLSGLYVTPGLVDIHVHAYTGTGMKALTGDQSISPDGFSFRNGIIPWPMPELQAGRISRISSNALLIAPKRAFSLL